MPGLWNPVAFGRDSWSSQRLSYPLSDPAVQLHAIFGCRVPWIPACSILVWRGLAGRSDPGYLQRGGMHAFRTIHIWLGYAHFLDFESQ